MLRAFAVPAGDARVIGLIGLGHGCSHFYQLVLPPLFPFLIADFGVSYTELGLLMTLFYVSSGLAQTPAGFLVDRFGARNVLTLGLALLAGATMLFGLMPGFWWLLPLVVLTGFGNSVFHPADYSILSASIGERRLGRAYALHTFGGNLGWAAAPGTVYGIAAAAGWRPAVIAVGAVGLIVALVLLLQREHLAEDSAAARRSAGGQQPPGAFAALLTRPVMVCFVYFFLFAIALIGIQSFLAASLVARHGTPEADAYMALTAYLFGSSAGVLAGGLLADRSSRHEFLVGAGLGLGALMILLVGATPLPTAALVGAVGFAGFVMGATTPSRDMLVRASATRGATGRVFGFVYSALDAGAAIGPLVIGLLLDHGRSHAVFWFIALMLAAAVASAFLLRRAAPPAPVPAQ